MVRRSSSVCCWANLRRSRRSGASRAGSDTSRPPASFQAKVAVSWARRCLRSSGSWIRWAMGLLISWVGGQRRLPCVHDQHATRRLQCDCLRAPLLPLGRVVWPPRRMLRGFWSALTEARTALQATSPQIEVHFSFEVGWPRRASAPPATINCGCLVEWCQRRSFSLATRELPRKAASRGSGPSWRLAALKWINGTDVVDLDNCRLYLKYI